MKVDKSKARNPDEEYVWLFEEIGNYGSDDDFGKELHPNALRALNIHRDKMLRKMSKLVDSAEYLDYNPYFKKQIKKSY